MSSTSIDLLKRLTSARAISGHEDAVRAIVRSELDGVGALETDAMGNTFCVRDGSSPTPRVLLECHMDEVGFMVQHVTSAGFVKFLTIGGWWNHTLLAQRVTISVEGGEVPGIIGATPPHLLASGSRDKVMNIEDLFIDIGAESREQAEVEFGVVPGCAITPSTEWLGTRHSKRYVAKAFDNRVGVALMIETMKTLGAHPNTLIGAACVQEEVGVRGAPAACETAKPDVAIVLEAPPADDLPGFAKEASQGTLGAGPQIRLYDPTMITNPRLAQAVIDLAERSDIPHQRAVRRSGGTDAGGIHKSRTGIPSIVLGVPTRYIHSHESMIDMNDYEATLELILQFVAALDDGALADIVRG